MKKLIAILTIAIVLVGAVFATDEAQINITAVISSLDPAFRLTAKTITTEESGSSSTAGVVGTPGSVTLATDMLLSGNASIVFDIEQIATSRTKTPYLITVSASDLLLTTVASGHTNNQKFTNAISAYKGEGITDELTGVNHVTTTKPSAGPFRFAYDGTTINATTDSAVVLGEFTVTWTGNSEAEVGTYSAYVKIEIATTT